MASKQETNRFLNENFAAYLKKQTKDNHKLDIHIDIKTPAQEKGLQVVDCVVWSFFRKYEHDDVICRNTERKGCRRELAVSIEMENLCCYLRGTIRAPQQRNYYHCYSSIKHCAYVNNVVFVVHRTNSEQA